MSKGPGRKTKHHRKPRSLGGRGDNGNIVIVTRREHEAWHCLFSNMPAPEILSRLIFFYRLFSSDLVLTQPRFMPLCTCEQLKAWIILFGNMELEDIVNVINATWLDPDFKLVVATEEAKKLCIKKVTVRNKQNCTIKRE